MITRVSEVWDQEECAGTSLCQCGKAWRHGSRVYVEFQFLDSDRWYSQRFHPAVVLSSILEYVNAHAELSQKLGDNLGYVVHVKVPEFGWEWVQ